MKKAIYIIMCMMLMSMSAFAQEKVKITDIKGFFIDEDGELKIDLHEFLSVPEYKTAFVAELNRRLKENLKKKGITDSKLAITDFGPSEVSEEQTNSAAVGEVKSGKRKSNPFAAKLETATDEVIKYTYESIDGKKNPITLSACAYVPDNFVISAHGLPSFHVPVFEPIVDMIQLIVSAFQAAAYKRVQSVLLSCHPTVTSNFEAPTGPNAPENAIKCMNSEKVLVICPDYCGYGATSYAQHPYLIQDITARQCIDAELAGLDLINNVFFDSIISDDYYTNIIGYSQGGSVALACAKYLESDVCPKETKDKIKLKHTYCGDGPYSAVETVNQYFKWQDEGKVLEYPCVLPLIVMAAKDAYDDDCMRTVKVEDYFSEKFLNTDVINMLKSKTYTTVDLNNKISALMGTDENTGLPCLMPRDLFSEKMLDENSNEHKCLMRALEKNDLTKGWTPIHPITFYHWTNDGVVPYCNTKAIKKGIGKNNDNINYVTDRIKRFGKSHVVWGWALDAALPSGDDSNIKHADAGIIFYIYYFSGELRPSDEK